MNSASKLPIPPRQDAGPQSSRPRAPLSRQRQLPRSTLREQKKRFQGNTMKGMRTRSSHQSSSIAIIERQCTRPWENRSVQKTDIVRLHELYGKRFNEGLFKFPQQIYVNVRLPWLCVRNTYTDIQDQCRTMERTKPRTGNAASPF